MSIGVKAADAILERVKHEGRRAALTKLCAESGIQGSSALRFAAQLMRYYADGAEYPSAPAALSRAETRFVESRCIELLEPYENDGLFPRMRQLPEVL